MWWRVRDYAYRTLAVVGSNAILCGFCLLKARTVFWSLTPDHASTCGRGKGEPAQVVLRPLLEKMCITLLLSIPKKEALHSCRFVHSHTR